MKQLSLLLLILTIIVATAGCTSQNTDQNTTLNNGDTGHSQIQNSTPNSSETPNPGANSRYEATGLCYHVVDGDTIDVEGVGRIRLVGVNTPERGEPGYQSATDFVKSMVEGKVVGVDIDDYKHYDKYDRTLAVVYIDGLNLNQELLKRGYAEVMYIPPSEFNPYSWA
jgi:endonuclease YncB( thermonuclease family)